MFTVSIIYCIVARKRTSDHVKIKIKPTKKQYLLRIGQVNNRRRGEHFPFLQAPHKYRPSDSFPTEARILELRGSLLPPLDLIENSHTTVRDTRIPPFEDDLTLSFRCRLVLLKPRNNLINKKIPWPLAFFFIADLNGGIVVIADINGVIFVIDDLNGVIDRA